MTDNTFIKFVIQIPKDHAKYLSRFATDNQSTQRHILRLMVKSYIEKKIMPLYPDIDGIDAMVNELETMLDQTQKQP